MSFVSTDDVPQGPYYTVGWLMSAVVERELGRQRLVEPLCDPAMFLRDYNRAAQAKMSRGHAPLPIWSDVLINRISERPRQND
jgi:hypothetical protein